MSERACWIVFIFFLLYASGVPLMAISVLQQTGSLPPLSNSLFWWLMYPMGGASNFGPKDENSDNTEGRNIDLNAPSYLVLAIPFFVAALLVEAFMIHCILPPRKQPLHKPRLNDTMTSLSLGVLNLIISLVLFISWTKYCYDFIWDNFRLTDEFSDSNANGWWLCLVTHDFLYYVWHRTSHTLSWFWTNHVVHHSSEEYNLSTALRQPFNDNFCPSFIVGTLPLAFLYPFELAALHGTFSLLYQYWIHTCLIPPLPTFELVFNSPSLHRIHHSRNVRALGKNYAAIFIIWDRIFGTYEPEIVSNDSTEIYYGVVPPLHTFDPLWANLHHYHHMLFVQWKWTGILTPFSHWTPVNGKGCPEVGTHKYNSKEKYDPPALSSGFVLYACTQFVFALTMTLFFLLKGVSSLTDIKIIKDSGLSDWAAEATAGTLIFLAVLWTLHAVGAALDALPPEEYLTNEVVRHIIFAGFASTIIVLSDSDNLLAWIFVALYTVTSLFAVFRLSLMTPIKSDEPLLPENAGDFALKNMRWRSFYKTK